MGQLGLIRWFSPARARHTVCHVPSMAVHSLNDVADAELRGATTARRDIRLITIASAASVLFLLISATAKIATYRINPIFLIPLMWAPYFFRRRMHLHAAHYLMFALAI